MGRITNETKPDSLVAFLEGLNKGKHVTFGESVFTEKPWGINLDQTRDWHDSDMFLDGEKIGVFSVCPRHQMAEYHGILPGVEGKGYEKRCPARERIYLYYDAPGHRDSWKKIPFP